MFTARTMMFSWVPPCLKHSASPTLLCCSSCAHEPSQDKVGAKRHLAKALAAGTREAESASGRTNDKGRSPSRSRSPRRAVPLHAAWKHDNVRRAAPKIQREGFRATETTTHTATTCGILSSRRRSAGWALSTRLWQRKLLEQSVWPMLRDWSGQDSDVVPLLLGTQSARKSRGEELGRSELFRSNSTAALKCQAQFFVPSTAPRTT